MTTPATEAEGADAARLGRALQRAGAYTLLGMAFCLLLLRGENLSILLFRTQDVAALLLIAVTLLLLAWRRPAVLALPRRLSPPVVAAGAAALALCASGIGTWLVFGGYALTRDEICANFDAAFLARGLLFSPVPMDWQPYSRALMPQFMLPLPANVGWLSAYLPGNAALRALGALTVGAEWVNPALAAISVAALYRIGRRLWPDTPRIALVPVLLLVSSAQFLTMAMTSYAMAAHLAVNLLWLWCFLRDDRRGDAGAVALGLVGTGLHQLLFHPLFVLPFVIQLWLSGRRGRALFYVGAYALIGLFWASYWQIILAGQGAASGEGPGGLSYLFARLIAQLMAIDPSGLALMALNLMRLLSWQNVALVPLVVLAWPSVRRAEGLAGPLAAGALLTVIVMLVLLPWQGHGWGYRYLHGFLGSLCLLAGYGWKSLSGAAAIDMRRSLLAVGTAVSLIVILPLHLKQAHDFVAPYRNASTAIARAPAEVVLVDGQGLQYAEDLVRNAPDLSNRPKVMDLHSLTTDQIVTLCRDHSVARFGASQADAFGILRTGPVASARGQLLDRISCGAPVSR